MDEGALTVWLSTRHFFREGDEGWARYRGFIGLPQLREVRTIDSSLNRYVDGCGSSQIPAIDEVSEVIRRLPRPDLDRHYFLLYLDAESEERPPEGLAYRLLGHDLSDYTQTSSLLNCGPWEGRLAPFAQRLNQYGLLSFDDARRAKELLPQAWPDDPHADVTIWALYEVAPPETKEEAKARCERDVFAEFVDVARLPVVPGSVQNRPTPEPDILCELAGGEKVAFELVQLVDPDLAASLARDIAAGTSTAVWYADPTLDRVREKTRKKRYVTAHPMELLVYGDDLMLPYDVWLPKFEKDLKDLLDGSAFRRLWVVNLTPRESSRRVWLVHPPYPPSGR